MPLSSNRISLSPTAAIARSKSLGSMKETQKDLPSSSDHRAAGVIGVPRMIRL